MCVYITDILYIHILHTWEDGYLQKCDKILLDIWRKNLGEGCGLLCYSYSSSINLELCQNKKYFNKQRMQTNVRQDAL